MLRPRFALAKSGGITSAAGLVLLGLGYVAGEHPSSPGWAIVPSFVGMICLVLGATFITFDPDVAVRLVGRVSPRFWFMVLTLFTGLVVFAFLSSQR